MCRVRFHFLPWDTSAHAAGASPRTPEVFAFYRKRFVCFFYNFTFTKKRDARFRAPLSLSGMTALGLLLSRALSSVKLRVRPFAGDILCESASVYLVCGGGLSHAAGTVEMTRWMCAVVISVAFSLLASIHAARATCKAVRGIPWLALMIMARAAGSNSVCDRPTARSLVRRRSVISSCFQGSR